MEDRLTDWLTDLQATSDPRGGIYRYKMMQMHMHNRVYLCASLPYVQSNGGAHCFYDYSTRMFAMEISELGQHSLRRAHWATDSY
jgi:hypothetical protein